MMSEGEIRRNVLERSDACPFCGYEPQLRDVSKAVSDEYDEEYYGVDCRNCPASYGDDYREWVLPTPPGEDAERVRAE